MGVRKLFFLRIDSSPISTHYEYYPRNKLKKNLSGAQECSFSVKQVHPVLQKYAVKKGNARTMTMRQEEKH